jgi:hypothetical protein
MGVDVLYDEAVSARECAASVGRTAAEVVAEATFVVAATKEEVAGIVKGRPSVVKGI